VVGLVVVVVAVVVTLVVVIRTGRFGYSYAIVAAAVGDAVCCNYCWWYRVAERGGGLGRLSSSSL
jgi:uncharacterized Fe-S cluster-containing radical SAM superfamily protein